MKLHRFYNDIPINNNKNIMISSPMLFNQMRNVLHFSIGDKVVIFDNSGFDFIATVDKYEKDIVYLKIIEKIENNVKTSRETYLFSSILKKSNFDWVVEKATELGVLHIVPIISDRSEKKGLNKNRLQKIIIEASEQSGRGILPELHEMMDLKKAISNYSNVKSIAWDPKAPRFSEKDVCIDNEPKENLSDSGVVNNIIGAYIGPEGGWTEQELELFKKNNVPIYSLGPQILRAETAVVAVISRMVF
ncbi:MAG TPA: RsmE family RNA methyltransferase [Candidatus Paceibacterota bacterium]